MLGYQAGRRRSRESGDAPRICYFCADLLTLVGRAGIVALEKTFRVCLSAIVCVSQVVA